MLFRSAKRYEVTHGPKISIITTAYRQSSQEMQQISRRLTELSTPEDGRVERIDAYVEELNRTSPLPMFSVSADDIGEVFTRWFSREEIADIEGMKRKNFYAEASKAGMAEKSARAAKGSPLKVQIEMDMSGVKAQIAEAIELLQKVPKSVAHHLSSLLFESLSFGSFEFGEATHRTALGTGEVLLSYRPRIVGDFQRVIAALRAKHFDIS